MNARMVLAEMTKKIGIGYTVERVSSLKGLDAKVRQLETPYVYFEIPGDNTAKGRSVERCVVVGGGTARIPMDFPRKVVCELLDLQDRVDWKKCATSPEEEGLAARVIREQFAPFDPKKKK